MHTMSLSLVSGYLGNLCSPTPTSACQWQGVRSNASTVPQSLAVGEEIGNSIWLALIRLSGPDGPHKHLTTMCIAVYTATTH